MKLVKIKEEGRVYQEIAAGKLCMVMAVGDSFENARPWPGEAPKRRRVLLIRICVGRCLLLDDTSVALFCSLGYRVGDNYGD